MDARAVLLVLRGLVSFAVVCGALAVVLRRGKR
jgi:hypothetical protein